MSSKLREKTHPIDEDGINSIERQIAALEKKKEKAEKFGHTKAANRHGEKIDKLEIILKCRKAASER